MRAAVEIPAYFSGMEIATLTGVSRQAVHQMAHSQKWEAVARRAQGGGKLYRFDSMPQRTQERLARAYSRHNRPTASRTPEEIREAQERMEVNSLAFARQSDKMRARAEQRLKLMIEAVELIDGGMKVMEAFCTVGNLYGVKPANLRNWYYGTPGRPGIRNLPREEWIYALMVQYAGRQKRADFDEVAKDFFYALYLKKRRPDLTDCYRRLVEAARANGWTIPSERTVRRIVAREDRCRVNWLRGKDRDFRDIMPPQKRDATVFASGEAVNGDGLTLDLWAYDPLTGEVYEHPVVWGWQDIRSRKLLGWRQGQTENTDLVRLSFYDVLGHVTPKHVWLDNTRAASNKLLSGLVPGIHRFGNKATDILGLFPQSGINVHFTNPDHEMSSPGSKPIERVWRDLHRHILNNPRLAGVGTKRNPVSETLLREVIAEEVARYNAQEGRRGAGMDGKSCNQVYEENFRPMQSMISPYMRRMFLLNREVVTVQRNGRVAINAGRGEGQNTYWSEVSSAHAGRKVVVYYDPEDLTKDVQLCNLSGQYLGMAQYEPSVAFNDKETGRRYAKARAARLKAEKKAAQELVKMNELEVRQYSTRAEAVPEPKPAHTSIRFGEAEVNRMISERNEEERARRVADMNRRIAALG